MIDISKQEIVDRIKEKKGLSDDEINSKIHSKIAELDGLVSETGAAHILANELGIKLITDRVSESPRLRIKNLVSGLNNISVYGRVLITYPITRFQRKKGKGQVTNLMIEDETGQTRLVLWDEKTAVIEKGELKPGDIIKITNVAVKENLEKLELHSRKHTIIQINPKDEEAKKIPEKRSSFLQYKNLNELEEGVCFVKGKIVHVFENNPFFEICQKCLRRARYEDGKYVCKEHGKFDAPRYSMVMNTIVDDGFSTMRCVFFGRNVERILGIKTEDAHKQALEANEFFKPIRDAIPELLGKDILLQVNVVKNQMFDRMELIVRSSYEYNPVINAQKLLQSVA